VHRTRTAWIVALGSALQACASVGPANPFVGETRYVLVLAARGGYLDATLSGDPEVRFLFPAIGACADILKPEAAVEYWGRGRYGELANPDPEGRTCAPLGVGNLEVWRNAGPRPTVYGASGSPMPRKTARFSEVWRDDAEIFLRGRFPLASWIGFRSDDVVAVVPNSENCRGVIADGEATMEYHYNGTPAYSLMMKPPAGCSIRAFAIPPPTPKRVKDAAGG
jgi:hypothetical protein